MRIGVFDSGLGGLLVTQAIGRRLPAHDLLYLGDTLRVPYGGRSQDAVHGFVEEALDYLFSHECGLVVLACHTASRGPPMHIDNGSRHSFTLSRGYCGIKAGEQRTRV